MHEVDTTVGTAIFLHGSVDAEDLYDKGLEALLTYEDKGHTFLDVHRHEVPQDDRTLFLLGGMESKMVVSFRPDGKELSDEGDFLLRRGACPNPDCKPERHYPRHHMLVAFNTEVGYTDSKGWNCGQFHAALIYRIGEWLDQIGVKWSWVSTVMPHVSSSYAPLSELGAKCEERKERVAYELAMASLPSMIPLNSMLGLMVFAEKVAASRDEEEDEEDEDRWSAYEEDE